MLIAAGIGVLAGVSAIVGYAAGLATGLLVSARTVAAHEQCVEIVKRSHEAAAARIAKANEGYDRVRQRRIDHLEAEMARILADRKESWE